ncbi:MAG: HAMP domain-containing histidine kinase [Clostridiales bacterium]|nr:HAMP domain-containing histidine kinase [Clostridiales bacterium]
MFKKPAMSLRFKLTAAFLSITLAAFTLVGIFANVILERQFEKYVINNLAQKSKDIVAALENRYINEDGSWDVSGLDSFGMNVLEDGFILRITDSGNKVVWDAMTHNSGFCASMLQSMAKKMESRKSGFSGGYTEKSYPVASTRSISGTPAGYAVIGYYGPYFYTDNDIRFLATLNKLLVLATVIACIFSLILGTYMARHLTGPISRVIRTAGSISEGRFDARITEVSGTTEIIELTGAINSLAENLGRQEALRKRLTADVAHELRTPVANLQSHLEAMIDGIWAPSAERLESCHAEALRLTGIINDLETLARFEGENMVLKKEVIVLEELTERLVRSFEKQAADKDIRIITDMGGQSVSADRDKLSRIIVNLLSNALKYTPAGGSIYISAKGKDSRAEGTASPAEGAENSGKGSATPVTNPEATVEISVRDTGIGISKEDLGNVFERFYRVDRSRSRETGGSGIGLTIVRSIAAAHGGTVSVNSTPGAGTEFIVTLPKS